MLSIDPSKLQPVPKEDIERLREAVRERVIKPYKARQREARRRAYSMNLPLWSAIREYIDAEIKLGMTRHIASTTSDPMVRRVLIEEGIPKLEEQSTRMETAVRAALEN